MILKRTTQISGSAGKPILIDFTYKANAQPKQIVVFCHGFKGFKDWGPFNKIADHFAQQDIIFVKFNFSYNGTTIADPLNFVLIFVKYLLNIRLPHSHFHPEQQQ